MPVQDRLRRRHRQRDRAHADVDRRAARRHARGGSRCRRRRRAPTRNLQRARSGAWSRSMRCLDEAARREHDAAARADRDLLAGASAPRRRRSARRRRARAPRSARRRARARASAATAARSFCIKRPPACPGICGTWPRGAGFATCGYGHASSLPGVDEAVVGRRLAAVVRVEDRLERHALVDEPVVVRRRCLGSRARSSPRRAAGRSVAIRYLNISSGESSKPHSFWSGVPPPR